MILSHDAQRLWDTALSLKASALDRCADDVSRAGVASLPPLLFFTDPIRTPRPWETAARLPPGSGVVYRHFGAADARAVAVRLRRITLNGGVRLLIGRDADLAEDVGADGVHLPEMQLALAASIRATHPNWCLTGAVHSSPQPASTSGLSAVVLSPIFPAGGASAARTALGPEVFSMMAAIIKPPVYALGGIRPETLDALSGSGACGIAAIDAIHRTFAA